MPLFCACGAFGALAIAMIVEHTYMLVAVSRSTDLVTWDPESGSAKNLTWQAAFFFFTTWYENSKSFYNIYHLKILTYCP